jgi:hypothetical protein
MLKGVDGGKQSILLFYEILTLNQNVRSTTTGVDPGFQVRGVIFTNKNNKECTSTGADSGGVHPERAPPKIGKNMIFWRKIVIFHTKYLKNFRASLGNYPKCKTSFNRSFR